jgi:hypothetical protein
LKEVMGKLGDLMREVDADGLNDLVGKLAGGKKIEPGIEGSGVAVKKGDDTAEVETLKSTVARLEGELAEIKKARAPSKSVEGEGGSETNVSKSQGGGLWDGLGIGR